MAQGKYKAPNVQAHGKKKQKREKNTMKKGRMLIAPKKKSLQEGEKLKKGLEKTIRSHIEDELTSKTASLEPVSFKMLSNSSRPTSSKGKGKGKGKKK